MASNQEKNPGGRELQLRQQPAKAQQQQQEKLLVVGNPVVVSGDGSRLSLSGELTPEQREQLGEAKVQSLRTAGHLQTQEQLDETERLRTEEAQRREQAQFGGGINPNFGTPSMTPEAMAKSDADKETVETLQQMADRPNASGQGNPGGGGESGAGSEVEQTPIAQLGLAPRIQQSLEAAGLATVGAVMQHGEENEGLQDIEGIGEASEEEIKEAIDKLLADQESK